MFENNTVIVPTVWISISESFLNSSFIYPLLVNAWKVVYPCYGCTIFVILWSSSFWCGYCLSRPCCQLPLSWPIIKARCSYNTSNISAGSQHIKNITTFLYTKPQIILMCLLAWFTSLLTHPMLFAETLASPSPEYPQSITSATHTTVTTPHSSFKTQFNCYLYKSSSNSQ